jgi:hypothetical protein
MKTKQTAVEWLYEQLNALSKPILNDYFQIVFSKAKEIEKQQAEYIWEASEENTHRQFSFSSYKPITFEQYYNETFNKQLNVVEFTKPISDIYDEAMQSFKRYEDLIKNNK